MLKILVTVSLFLFAATLLIVMLFGLVLESDETSPAAATISPQNQTQ